VSALHAEWTKFRTARGNGSLLVATAALTALVSTLIAWSVHYDLCPPDQSCDADTPRLALAGVYAGQILVIVFAVLMISNEYATGMVHTSLAATPQRLRVFAAKVVVTAAGATVAGATGVAGALLGARVFQQRNGFTPVNGFRPLSLGDHLTARAAYGTVLYMALIALLSLGVATLLRDTGAALSAVLALLLAAPILTLMTNEQRWREWLEKHAPMSAGLAIQATKGLATHSIGGWRGLGVLALYAAGALILGATAFICRDA
jgi:ABC-2 type transport system permease protein